MNALAILRRRPYPQLPRGPIQVQLSYPATQGVPAMPTMTRAHYNLIADATFAIIERIRAMHHVSSVTPLEGQIATLMTEAVAGTNSAFKADRFRERCLGIRGSR